MRSLFALLLLAALPLLAADFAGKWKGHMKLKSADGKLLEEGAASLDLKQAGAVITGRACRDNCDDSMDVQNGKADGDTLTFQVPADDGPAIDVKLTLSGNQLTGEAKGTIDGQKVVAELKFQRE